MRKPRCACKHPDAQACFEARYPNLYFTDEDQRLPDHEKCDCVCHDENEDGRTGWDDDES